MNRSDLQDSSSDEDSLCGIGKTDGESRLERPFGRKQFLSDDDNSLCEEFVDSLGIFEPIHTRIFVGNVIMLFF
jgi:hypothetical protein